MTSKSFMAFLSSVSLSMSCFSIVSNLAVYSNVIVEESLSSLSRKQNFFLKKKGAEANEPFNCGLG
jgi:hypothetical protein